MPSEAMRRAHDAWRTFAAVRQPSLEAMRKALDDFMAKFPLPDGVEITPAHAGGISGEWIAATGATPSAVVLWLHGGGYCMGSLATARDLAGRVARAAPARVLTIDYRLAPECPFPAAVEDVVSGYRWLLTQGVEPADIVIGGDSAGGGLAIAALLALRDAGDPLPAGAVCVSPFADLEVRGRSMETRAAVDPLGTRVLIERMASLYLGSTDPRTPLASPVVADLGGLPPTLIQVGSDDVLLDDATRLAARVAEGGGDVTLEVVGGAPHVWHVFASFLPEAEQAIDRIGAFLRSATTVRP